MHLGLTLCRSTHSLVRYCTNASERTPRLIAAEPRVNALCHRVNATRTGHTSSSAVDGQGDGGRREGESASTRNSVLIDACQTNSSRWEHEPHGFIALSFSFGFQRRGLGDFLSFF